MLSVQGVSSGYGRILAIRDMDIEVKQGEVVVLIGANGAGKSTLLRTISGVLRPDKGQILFEDQRIDGKKLYRKRITFVSPSTPTGDYLLFMN